MSYFSFISMSQVSTRFGRYLQNSRFFQRLPSPVRRYLYTPAGPLTIFFWAPAFKWALVIAGLADLARPAEKLSMRQSTALALTGFIWSRYSMVVIPRNWLLFAVNLFLGGTGLTQMSRVLVYNRSLKKGHD